MEMSTLTFLSWVVMSAMGWSFLVVEEMALVEGPFMVGPEGWLVSSGVGFGRLGLDTSAVGL